jgi:hypothetical protein
MSRISRIFGLACFALLANALPAPDLIDDESLECWSSLDAAESAYEVWKSESTVYTSSLALFTSLDTNVPHTTLNNVLHHQHFDNRPPSDNDNL